MLNAGADMELPVSKVGLGLLNHPNLKRRLS